MQNHVMNMMQFRKRSCNEELPSYGHFVPKCNQNNGKFTSQAAVKKTNCLAGFDD